MQNLFNVFGPSEIVGNNYSVSFSPTPCGKKVAAPMSSRPSRPSSREIGEASESSIVAARLRSAAHEVFLLDASPIPC